MNTLRSTVVTSQFFDGKVLTFSCRGIEDDRGELVPIYFDQIPFHPVRAFMVRAPAGVSRGGHAYRAGGQILMRVSGEIHVELFWRNEEKTIVLGAESNAMLIASPVWSRQTYRGDSPCLMVFCDTPYDPNSYIYEKF